MKSPGVTVVTVVVLLVLVFAPLGRAQEGRGDGRLSGVVYDTDNHPVSGAAVTLEYFAYNRRLTTVTDKKGQWAFLTLGKGQVKVTIEKEGFISAFGQVPVSSLGQNPRQSIILRRLAERKPAETGPAAETEDAFTKAFTLFKERKFETALALFLDFRQRYPDRYPIGVHIGNCYLELQRYEEALHELQTVARRREAGPPQVKGEPELAEIYAAIADIYMRQDKFPEAEAALKKSLALDPTNYAWAYNVAEILFAAGNTGEAIRYYELALRLKPGSTDCYRQLGYAYLHRGDTKAAVQYLGKFLELAPHSPQAPGIKEVIQSLQ